MNSVIERVDAAEAASHGRLLDLQYDSGHHDERQLIEHAQCTLEKIRITISFTSGQ